MIDDLHMPTGDRAVDDAGTQAALQQATRWLWTRFAKQGGGSLLVILLVLVSGIDWLFIVALAAFFVLIYSLRINLYSLYFLRRIKRVLEVYPWSSQLRVKKSPQAVERPQRRGIIAWISHGDGQWLGDFWASDFRGPKAWSQEMVDGVWFAGDIAFGGVVARPGCTELAYLYPWEVKGMDAERQSATADRQEQAKQAGLGKPLM